MKTLKYQSFAAALAGIALCCLAGAACAEGEGGDLLLQGRAALEDGFYAQAEKSLAGWLKDRTEKDPGAIEVLNQYCRALDGLGRTGDIRSVVKTGAPSKLQVGGTPFAAYWSAYCDYREGNFVSATNVLQAFAGAGDSGVFGANALRLRGWCLLGLGKTNDAVRAFAEFEDRFAGQPGSAMNLLELSELLYKTRDFARAESYLARLEQLGAGGAAAARGRHLLGLTLRALGKGPEARSVFEKLAGDETAAGDIRAEAFIEAAETAAAAGDLAGAASACVRGLALTQNADLQMRGNIVYGHALINSGQLKDGLAVLKGQVVKMTSHDQSSQLQLEVARSLLAASNNVEAVGEFQFYLETFTNSTGLVDAHLGKGWGLFRLERYAEAAGEFQKAYEMSESPELRQESLYKMGDAYFANGQHKLALDAYDLFLSEFKDSAKRKNVSFQRAEALVGAGRVEEAEKQYLDIARDYSSEALGAEALLRTGWIKSGRADPGGATADFESVMKRFPASEYYVRALHGRAKTFLAKGDYTNALADLAEITEKYPESTPAQDALYEMGLSYNRMGMDDEVEKVFTELLLKYPESKWAPDVVFWQGEREFNRGDMEKAEQVFMGFIDKYPGNVLVPEALLRAGMAAGGRKEYVRAIELFTRLAKDYSSSVRIPDARFAQANALCELGRFSEAILPLDEIINKYPESPLVTAAWGRKGDCHFTMGSEDPKRYEESIQCYRVVVSSSKSSRNMVLQSEYKIGRSLEKLGKEDEALDRYYLRVMMPFLEQQKNGEKHDESERVWFTRASLAAAQILEKREDWKRAANVLERIAESGVPASKEAEERARKIRADHWWLFY